MEISPTHFMKCFNIITVTGRKEHLCCFRASMDDSHFHFIQTVYPCLGDRGFDKREKWGTEEFISATIIEDTPNKIVIFCETLKTPGLEWAKLCEEKFRQKRVPITIQINYYSLATLKYGIYIVKAAGFGQKQWDIRPIRKDKDGKGYDKTHFDYFFEQFGFVNPKVKELLHIIQ